jgi:SH3 domain protein
LRTGKGIEYRIIALLKDGSQVEILEDERDWAKVRTENKSEGWILKRYLSSSSPLKLKTQSSGTNKQLEEILEAKNQCEQDLEACILEKEQIKNAYNKLKQDAADVVYIKESLSKAEKELQELKHEYALLEEENKQLRDSNKIKWFLAGGGILVVGWIIGLITTRQRKRRPSLL